MIISIVIIIISSSSSSSSSTSFHLQIVLVVVAVTFGHGRDGDAWEAAKAMRQLCLPPCVQGVLANCLPPTSPTSSSSVSDCV